MHPKDWPWSETEKSNAAPRPASRHDINLFGRGWRDACCGQTISPKQQDAVLGAELGELKAHTLAGDYVANGALGFAAVQ
jgi:hypothetical protein